MRSTKLFTAEARSEFLIRLVKRHRAVVRSPFFVRLTKWLTAKARFPFSELFKPMPNWFAVCLYTFAVFFAAVFVALLIRLASYVFFAGSADSINKLLLGIAGLVGAPFLFWRTWIADRQRHIAQEEHYTALLVKAVEQLGATREEKNGSDIKTVPNLEVRLGGIYALEKLARDYEPLHWQVMEILCAYVRKNAGPPQPCSLEMRATYAKADQTDEERISRRHRKAELKAATDVQACLTVIGRRSQKQRDWETTKKATEADGAGSGAFRLDLRACHLAGADLSGLHFDKANFEGACLEGTTLDEARLQGALLDDVHLEGASLEKAHLESASLVGAHIEGAWLSGVRLADASLGGARLKGSSLYGADLEGAELYWVELDDAELDDAHLEGASLEGAWLFRAHLKGAKDLTQAQLESAYGDETTELPEGLSRPSHWIKLSNDSDATADLAPDTEAK